MRFISIDIGNICQQVNFSIQIMGIGMDDVIVILFGMGPYIIYSSCEYDIITGKQ